MNRKDPKGLLLHTKLNDTEYLQQRTNYLHISNSRHHQKNKRSKNRNMVHNYIYKNDTEYLQQRTNYLHRSNSRHHQKNKRSNNRNMVHNYIHNDIIQRIEQNMIGTSFVIRT